MIAKGAFLYHSPGSTGYFRFTPGWNGWIRTIEGFPIECSSIIGTGNLTITAANAAIIIHHHDTIRSIVTGFDRTHIDTGGLFALHARPGKINPFSIYGTASGDSIPGDIGMNIIMRSTSQGTKATALAFILINYHRPSMGTISSGF
jgi:hypothetical protein